MDRQYAILRKDLAQAKAVLRHRQITNFRQEAERNQIVEFDKALSIGLAAILLTSLFCYARRLQRDVLAAQERERYVVTLRERKAELRQAMLQRDVQDAQICHQQKQLLRQEAQLNEAQRIARLGNWELDVMTGGVMWSDELHAILGYAPGQMKPSFKAYMTLLLPGRKNARLQPARRGFTRR